jgi:hypothetical protein
VSTENLAATAVGNYDQWENVGGADKVASVALPDDGIATNLRTYFNGYRQSFTLATSSIPAGSTINSVSVRSRLGTYEGSDVDSTRVFLRLGGTNADTSARTCQAWVGGLQPGYVYIDEISRPGGGSWTLSDLATLEVGVACEPGSNWAGVTTLYVIVDYTEGGGTPVEVLADGLRLVTAEGSALADARRLVTVEASALADSLRIVTADATALSDALRHVAVDASALSDATRFVQVDASALPDSLRHVSTSASVQSDTRRTVVATVSALADSLRIVVTGMYAIVRADTLRIVTSSASALSDITRRVGVSASAIADSRRLVTAAATVAADAKRTVTATATVLADTLRTFVGGGIDLACKIVGRWESTVASILAGIFRPPTLRRKGGGRWK